MPFKVNKINYAPENSRVEDFYHAIRTEVNQYFAGQKQHRYANKAFWTKAIILVFAALGCYSIMISSPNAWSIILCYLLFSWFLLLTGFNIAHDAAHGSLTGKKKKDNTLFELAFCMLGANPYLWKIRHIYSHHPYPNVEGCDADIELTILLRFSDEQPLRKIHAWQHAYAPFLYCIYTLYWIFYKDFVLFFRKKQANINFTNHPPVEWIKLFAFKIFYLGLFVVLPIVIHPEFCWTYIIAFVVSHFINSLYLLFTFLISHHVPQTHSMDHGMPGNTIQHSWAVQQVISSADFHAEEKWAYWFFGGFNAHVAHHLFPGICHVHYPVITRIIRQQLAKTAVPYHSFSWWQGTRYHLQLLKRMGRPVLE